MAVNLLSYLLFFLLSVLVGVGAYWKASSYDAIVELPMAPHVSGYLSGQYLDVHWVARRLNTCHSWNTPFVISARVGGFAEPLQTVQMLQYTDVTNFTRRYKMSLHLEEGRYVFRHELHSQCNPLFLNTQIIDIPFKIPLDLVESPP